jgi:PKD repeat protein
MKSSLIFLSIFFICTGLFAQTVCTVKIVYEMNKSLPPSYTFKTDPQTTGAKYYWTFGDNTISDSPSPVHTFKIGDTYIVQVKVTTSEGKICYGEVKTRFEGGAATPPAIVISGKGKVKKVVSNDGCGLLIVMDNGPVLVPFEMVTVFEFKDGQYVELAYELLKDKLSGCPAGVSARILKIYDITPPAICKVPVSFTKNSTSPVSYTFKTDAQPEGSTYYWYFGDGGSSVAASPSYSYKVANSYVVNLKILDKTGKVCYGELKSQFEGGAVSPPVIALSGKGKVMNLTAAAGCGLVVKMDNAAILIPAKISTDFQLKDGQYVEFTYEKLAEKITSCKEGSEVRIITIKEIAAPTDCKANFTATNQLWSDPAMMKRMVFANLSTGDIRECKWDFGDNTTSTELKPIHDYAAFGEYKVCLTIATIAGCKSDFCTTVKVANTLTNTGCKFDMVIQPKELVPNTFLFSVVCPVEIKSLKWSFGDGKTSDAKNPDHTYEKAGVYEVSCTIVTAAGCTQTNTVKHNVLATTSLPNCKGALSLLLYDPTDIKCNGSATVRLLDEAGKEISNVKFLWSDGRTGSSVGGLCPEKLYVVQANIENVCQKNTSFTLLSKPIWRASAVNGQNNFTVLSPVEGVQYEWDFGNGIVMAGAEVNFNFAKDGVYDVKLKAVSASGTSEYSQPVVVMKNIAGTDISNQTELGIYPNPAKEIIRIDFRNPVEGIIFIEIRNNAGQSVYLKQLTADGSSHADINVQNLKSGIYLLKITNGQRLIADRKFIKTD